LRDALSVHHRAIRGTKVGYVNLIHHEAHAAVLARNLGIVDDEVGGRHAPDDQRLRVELDAQSRALARYDRQVMGAPVRSHGTRAGSAGPDENGGATVRVVVCGQGCGLQPSEVAFYSCGGTLGPTPPEEKTPIPILIATSA
jgi:hypothetical protein